MNIIKNNIVIAKRYRKSSHSDVVKKSGLVLINNNGEAYGWRNELRNPETEKPGSIAVDTSGSCHIATGGDNYNGANAWASLL